MTAPTPESKLASELSEASMMGELAPRIIAADERGDDADLLLHAAEYLQSSTATALKQAMFLEMGYRRAYLFRRAMGHLKKKT